MTYVIEYYNPFDGKHYTERSDLEIVKDAFLTVLKRRGMEKITVFEE